MISESYGIFEGVGSYRIVRSNKIVDFGDLGRGITPNRERLGVV
jgi:hypothetical protein